MTPPADRDDAVLREAAHRLADTIAPYRVLTKDSLAELSGVGKWRSVSFEHALKWACDHEVLRALAPDLYEVCTPPASGSAQANG